MIKLVESCNLLPFVLISFPPWDWPLSHSQPPPLNRKWIWDSPERCCEIAPQGVNFVFFFSVWRRGSVLKREPGKKRGKNLHQDGLSWLKKWHWLLGVIWKSTNIMVNMRNIGLLQITLAVLIMLMLNQLSSIHGSLLTWPRNEVFSMYFYF